LAADVVGAASVLPEFDKAGFRKLFEGKSQEPKPICP